PHFMKETDTYSKPLRKFERLSLPHKALLTSAVGWSFALCVSVIYCFLYMRYVNSRPESLTESVMWFFQEYGFWIILTPVLLIGLSYFSRQRQIGWFWLLVAASLFGSIAFRLSLDFYLNPDAKFLSSLVYFTPGNVIITLLVVLAWALVYRQAEHRLPKSDQIRIEEIETTKSKLSVESLVAYKGNKSVSVSINSIQIVSAAGNYVELHCADNQYLLRSTMKELEEQLKSYNFIRVHRSHLVNPTAIASVQADTLVLNSGTKLTVSQRYRKNLNSFQ
ncbi:MAG: LytTR family DNA-binding domain-containing protein, partial [Pseudomonadota bacterium]